jgi:putative addiction module component (TIGR02574 family)
MPINTSELSALSPTEKLQLVEFLWDDLGKATAAIPLPAWVDQEAARRREEMHDSTVGFGHEEIWKRIERRRG